MSIHHPHTPWTPARVAKLRELWPTHSAAQIARALGCFAHTTDGGRNAVIGKAGRLGLPRKAPDPRDRPPMHPSDAAALKRARRTRAPTPPRNIGGTL